MKPVLTTGDVAEYCHVSLPTVFRWIKNGHLVAYTLPNGHHRILPNEFRAFLIRHGMPVWDETYVREGPKPRILIVDGASEVSRAIVEVLSRNRDRFDVESTKGTFEAGMLMNSLQPHLVVLDLTSSGVEGLEMLQRIRENPETCNTKVLVLTSPTKRVDAQRVLSLGADDLIGRVLVPTELLARVERLLPSGTGSRRIN
jgi:excisionase family DNA binding protein